MLIGYWQWKTGCRQKRSSEYVFVVHFSEVVTAIISSKEIYTGELQLFFSVNVWYILYAWVFKTLAFVGRVTQWLDTESV